MGPLVKPASAVESVLADSLLDLDPFQAESFRRLNELDIGRVEALVLLARHKSSAKYGFRIPEATALHVADLLSGPAHAPTMARPFFLMKVCWIYEHAPAFLPVDDSDPSSRDRIVERFAHDYRERFLLHHVPFSTWVSPARQTRRNVLTTTFWERTAFDPIDLLLQARKMGLAGLELALDFHPFNVTKTLPEEIDRGKRRELRQAIEESQLIVDVHSAIIGPYAPLPSPVGGKQVFYDPLKSRRIQLEIIDFAKDIGARDVNLHLVTPEAPERWADFVRHAAGSPVRVTIENYYQTEAITQTAEVFLDYLERIRRALPRELAERNFGVTIDVGHLNIEGDDPLVGAIRIGQWCREHGIYLRVHATDNYGLLLFSPPAFSADVHGNVSGKGINNGLIIRALRSLGHTFSVVAEQIKPLTSDDIATIHDACTCELPGTYEEIVAAGRERLQGAQVAGFVKPADLDRDPYCFVIGLRGLEALEEYMVCRTIQDKKHLSVDEAMRISREFMQMPANMKRELTGYIDDLLLPVQTETGTVERSQLDLICQNINGALFWSISNEHMNRIFSRTTECARADVLCEQHKPGQEMFFVKSGEVGVYIEGQRVATLGAGEIFGEISLFYNIPRSATIRAERNGTKVGVLTRSGLEALFDSREPYVCDLIVRLYKVLPGRLRNMNAKYQTAIGTLDMIIDDEAARKTAALVGEAYMADIQESDVLPKLSPDEAAAIFSTVVDMAPGDTVCEQGEEADGIYFVIEGKLQVSLKDPEGGEVDVACLESGEVFGEIALIEDTPRSATVRVMEGARLGFLGKKEFEDFVESGSDLAFRFMGYVCLLLFRRILRLDWAYSQIKRRIALLEA